MTAPRSAVTQPTAIPRPRFGEEWLIAVLDSLSEGVLALDQSGALIAANPAAERMLDFDLGTARYTDWRTLSWAALVDEAGVEIADEDHPIAAALRSRRAGAPCVVGIPRATSTCWLQLATHVLTAAGGLAPDGIVVSFQDVTDRVAVELDRQRLLGLQRELMAAASHDLRTPLTVVASTASWLLEDWAELDDENRLEGVSTIDRQVGRLSRLVEDLALISRLEGGGLVADTRQVPVAALVDAALDSMSVSSEIEVAVDADLTVLVDAEHGRRMLVNLLENACKYGDPPVRVDAGRVDDAIAITVSDRGPGVPESFVGQLFDRFTRATPDAGPGMGLGLAIVDRLARLNDGAVSYEDAPDGARFRLVLNEAGPQAPA